MTNTSTATSLVILLSLLLVLGFFLGSRANRLRARVQANWLRNALRTLGAEPSFSALGAFGFTSGIQRLSGALSAVDASVILLPREVPPLWLARVLTGRSDMLTFRASLPGPPAITGDLIAPARGYGRRAAQRIPGPWLRRNLGDWLLAAPGSADLARLEAIIPLVGDAMPGLQILSLRATAPQLLLTLAAPQTEAAALAAVDGLVGLATAVMTTRESSDTAARRPRRQPLGQ